MGPSEQGEEFAVEEPEPAIYNPTGIQPPIWQPAPQHILLMFQQLDANQVLPLKWTCPGRRPPEKEPAEQPSDFPMGGEEEEDDKEEEKRVPEPSEFDFDDMSETSAKVKMTPRTPVSAQARRPEKKVARMDNVLNSIKRQQKAEREARKSQARNLAVSPFRGGTPSRVTASSPVSSPRLPSATVSPGPGSPRPPAPTLSPPPRVGGDGGGTRGGAGEGTAAAADRQTSPTAGTATSSTVTGDTSTDAAKAGLAAMEVCEAEDRGAAEGNQDPHALPAAADTGPQDGTEAGKPV